MMIRKMKMYLQVYLKTHGIDDCQKKIRVSSFSADPIYYEIKAFNMVSQKARLFT